MWSTFQLRHANRQYRQKRHEIQNWLARRLPEVKIECTLHLRMTNEMRSKNHLAWCFFTNHTRDSTPENLKYIANCQSQNSDSLHCYRWDMSLSQRVLHAVSLPYVRGCKTREIISFWSRGINYIVMLPYLKYFNFSLFITCNFWIFFLHTSTDVGFSRIRT